MTIAGGLRALTNLRDPDIALQVFGERDSHCGAACSAAPKRTPSTASWVRRLRRMSSVVAELSDERFKTSRAIVFGPVTDTIFSANCCSAPAQFCALAGTANRNRQKQQDGADKP